MSPPCLPQGTRFTERRKIWNVYMCVRMWQAERKKNLTLCYYKGTCFTLVWLWLKAPYRSNRRNRCQHLFYVNVLSRGFFLASPFVLSRTRFPRPKKGRRANHARLTHARSSTLAHMTPLFLRPLDTFLEEPAMFPTLSASPQPVEGKDPSLTSHAYSAARVSRIMHGRPREHPTCFSNTHKK